MKDAYAYKNQIMLRQLKIHLKILYIPIPMILKLANYIFIKHTLDVEHTVPRRRALVQRILFETCQHIPNINSDEHLESGKVVNINW